MFLIVDILRNQYPVVLHLIVYSEFVHLVILLLASHLPCLAIVLKVYVGDLCRAVADTLKSIWLLEVCVQARKA